MPPSYTLPAGIGTRSGVFFLDLCAEGAEDSGAETDSRLRDNSVSRSGAGYRQGQQFTLRPDDRGSTVISRFVAARFFEKFTVTGRAYLDALKESGEGAVFMASHAGNWEILGAWLAMSGYPLISVAQQQNGGSDVLSMSTER